jgi:hypothetical protein
LKDYLRGIRPEIHIFLLYPEEVNSGMLQLSDEVIRKTKAKRKFKMDFMVKIVPNIPFLSSSRMNQK